MLRYANPLIRLRQKVSGMRNSPDYEDWADLLNSMEIVYGDTDELTRMFRFLEVDSLSEAFQKAVHASDLEEKLENTKDSLYAVEEDFCTYKLNVESLLTHIFPEGIPASFENLSGNFDCKSAAQEIRAKVCHE